MKLKLGKVVKYISESGYGFIKPLCFSSNSTNSVDVWFHIKYVKHLDIESNLIGIENKSPLYIWYIPEKNKKNPSKFEVKECWLDYNLIPKEYLIDFIDEAFLFLTQEKSKPSPPTQPQSELQDDPSILINYPCIITSHKPQYAVPPVQQPRPFVPQPFNPAPQSSSFNTMVRLVTLCEKFHCSDEEFKELQQWIKIYRKNNCKDHYEVNNYISRNNLWDKFPNIRSKNTHDNGYVADGIHPNFYEIICKALDISGANGTPLIDWRSY